MSKIFVLHHVHVIPGGDEDVKLLGVYSSDQLARQAVLRFNKQPGFPDLPHIVAPDSESDEGFNNSEYDLDRDTPGWAAGFGSDRKSAVEGRSVTDRVDVGGRRLSHNKRITE